MVFGPTSRNRFGNPATVMPRCAAFPSRFHSSFRVGAVAAGDPHPGQAAGHPEPRGEHQRVARVLGAVRGDHAAGRDPADPLGHQVDVVPREGGVVVAGEQHPLAADLIVRRQSRPQPGIGHLLVQVPSGMHLERLHQLRAEREPEPAQLQREVERVAERSLAGREPGVYGALARADRAVRLRRHPRCGALEHGQPFDLRGDPRYELDRACAGPDHRDPAAGQVVGVVPVRGVERGTGERAEPRQVRDPGVVQGRPR